MTASRACRRRSAKGDASRARLVAAADEARRRLERDLHDGAQQRLIALSLDLRSLEDRMREDPDARRQLEEAQQEITM